MSNFLGQFWEKVGVSVNDILGWGKSGWGNPYAINYIFGQKGPVFMNVRKPMEVYEEIPQVKAVIDRKALMFANMTLELQDKNGDEIEMPPELVALFENPNLLQGMNDWLVEFKQQEQVFGNAFMYGNWPSTLSKYPVTLQNIAALHITPVLTGKYFDQVKLNGIIEKYQFKAATLTRDFKTEYILWSKLNHLTDPLVGQSPIFSLKFPISNTKLAYEFRNVIMGESGQLGILSNEAKDVGGSIPMTPEQKKDIADQHTKTHGIGKGQSRVLVTDASVKYTPTTYPTKDLELFAEIDANLVTIIDHFGLNVNIFSQKNATYENVKESIKQVYEDTIQPEADKFTQKLGKFLGIPEGTKLAACYDHLAILQSDKSKEATTLKTQVEAISQLVDKKIISAETASVILSGLTGFDMGQVPIAEPATTVAPAVAVA